MAGSFSLDNYIDVAERIQHFKDAHPDGSLQTIDWSVAEIEGRHFIVYRAAAYRTPDDERPGHGIAWEPFPGPTSYTKDSELMNAETAAWGRAIVALGLAANRRIASRQEVRARQSTNGAADPSPQVVASKTTGPVADALEVAKIYTSADARKLPNRGLANIVLHATGNKTRDWTDEDTAGTWLERALKQLPADKVQPVLAAIAKGPTQ